MASSPPKTTACGECWLSHKTCIRDPLTGHCQKCKNMSKGEVARAADSLKYQASSTESHRYLLSRAAHGFSRTLNAGLIPIEHSCILQLQIHASLGSREPAPSFYSIPFNGSFDALDQFVKDTLAWKLNGANKMNHTIDTGTLIGAYIHLLSSAISARENVNVPYNEQEYEKMHDEQYLFERFQHIAFRRLTDLLETFFPYTQVEDSTGLVPSSMVSYAASTMLLSEIWYFRNSLIKGDLSGLNDFQKGFRILFLKWLDCLESKLRQPLYLGCGKNKKWSDSLDGPLKVCRRTRESVAMGYIFLRRKLIPNAIPGLASPFAHHAESSLTFAPTDAAEVTTLENLDWPSNIRKDFAPPEASTMRFPIAPSSFLPQDFQMGEPFAIGRDHVAPGLGLTQQAMSLPDSHVLAALETTTPQNPNCSAATYSDRFSPPYNYGDDYHSLEIPATGPLFHRTANTTLPPNLLFVDTSMPEVSWTFYDVQGALEQCSHVSSNFHANGTSVSADDPWYPDLDTLSW